MNGAFALCYERAMLVEKGGKLGPNPREDLRRKQDEELRDDPKRCSLRNDAIRKMLSHPNICAISWNWRVAKPTFYFGKEFPQSKMNNMNILNEKNPIRRDAEGNRMKNEPLQSMKHTWHDIYLKKT